MADLTADRYIRLGPGFHHVRNWVLSTAAAATVYRGQPLIIDQDVDTVYLVPYVDAVVLVTTNDRFVGICNSAQTSVVLSATENTEVEVIMSGLVGFKQTGFTDADVGRVMSMTDSSVLAAAAGGAGNCEIGRFVYYEDGYAYVEINAASGGAPTICA